MRRLLRFNTRVLLFAMTIVAVCLFIGNEYIRYFRTHLRVQVVDRITGQRLHRYRYRIEWELPGLISNDNRMGQGGPFDRPVNDVPLYREHDVFHEHDSYREHCGSEDLVLKVPPEAKSIVTVIAGSVAEQSSSILDQQGIFSPRVVTLRVDGIDDFKGSVVDDETDMPIPDAAYGTLEPYPSSRNIDWKPGVRILNVQSPLASLHELVAFKPIGKSTSTGAFTLRESQSIFAVLHPGYEPLQVVHPTGGYLGEVSSEIYDAVPLRLEKARPLRVHVCDSRTGKSLSGVTISFPSSKRDLFHFNASWLGDLVYATTDSNGDAFVDVPRYCKGEPMSLSKFGYENAVVNDLRWTKRDELTLSLDPNEYALSGKVLDAQGLPLPSFKIHVMGCDAELFVNHATFEVSTEDGTFHIPADRPTLSIWIECEGFAMQNRKIARVKDIVLGTVDPSKRHNLEFTLEKGSQVQGRLELHGRDPSRFLVLIVPQSSEFQGDFREIDPDVQRVAVDRVGKFQFDQVGRGDRRLIVLEHGAFVLENNFAVSARDLNLGAIELPATGSITGVTRTIGGTVVPFHRLVIRNKSNDFHFEWRSDAYGRFEIHHLPEADYEVGPIPEEPARLSCPCYSNYLTVDVPVKKSKSSEVRFSFGPVVHLLGLDRFASKGTTAKIEVGLRSIRSGSSIPCKQRFTTDRASRTVLETLTLPSASDSVELDLDLRLDDVDQKLSAPIPSQLSTNPPRLEFDRYLLSVRSIANRETKSMSTRSTSSEWVSSSASGEGDDPFDDTLNDPFDDRSEDDRSAAKREANHDDKFKLKLSLDHVREGIQSTLLVREQSDTVEFYWPTRASLPTNIEWSVPGRDAVAGTLYMDGKGVLQCSETREAAGDR